ncbi:hypothetical protein R1flu_019726 [Riccia fluitans]|uniref:Uncharacterized protein n=1 Tax=Riccia fluitans TaxID=41844 RepID=A0ABD1ZJG9_9MARC
MGISISRIFRDFEHPLEFAGRWDLDDRSLQKQVTLLVELQMVPMKGCRVEDVYRMIRQLGRAFCTRNSLATTPSTPRFQRGLFPLHGIANRVGVEQATFLPKLKVVTLEITFFGPCGINVHRAGTCGLYSVRTISTSSTVLGRGRVTAEHDTPQSDIGEEVKKAVAQYMEQNLGVDGGLAVEIAHKSPRYVSKLIEEMKATSQSGGDLKLAVKEVLTNSKFKGVEPYFESIGFSPEEIDRVIIYARYGLPGVIEKVNLVKSIGVKPEEIPRVVTTNPRSLSTSSRSLELKVQYLKQLGLSPDDIRKLVVSYPKALSFGLKNGRLPLVDFLSSKGVKDSEIGKVVFRCPQLVSLNVEMKLQPAIEVLETVGIRGDSLARVLVTQPSLLRRKLKRNIEYCRSLGLDEKPGVIARLLVTCPNFSEEGCKARMNYLQSLGLTKEQVVTMIRKNPAWLSFNVESSLSLKVNYLVNVMGRSVQELVTAVNFLTMSLEKRIVPRWTVLLAMEKAGLVTKTYKLSTLATWSDDYFEKRFVSRYSPVRERTRQGADSPTTHGKGSLQSLSWWLHPLQVQRSNFLSENVSKI